MHSKPAHPAPAKPLSTAEKRRRQSPASWPVAAPRSEHRARMRPASKPRLNTTTYSSWSGSAAAPPAAASGSAAATAAASRHRARPGSRRRRRRGRCCCCRCCVSITARVGKALPGSAARPGGRARRLQGAGLVGGQGPAKGVPHVEIGSVRAWEARNLLSNAGPQSSPSSADPMQAPSAHRCPFPTSSSADPGNCNWAGAPSLPPDAVAGNASCAAAAAAAGRPVRAGGGPEGAARAG